MIIDEPKLRYKAELPFEAELCHIGKTLPHRHPTELEMIYVLKGSIHMVAAEQDTILSAGDMHSIDFYDIHLLECVGDKDDNLVLLFHLDLSKLDNWKELQPISFACETQHCYPYQEAAMTRVKDIVLSLSYVYFNGRRGDFSGPVNELIQIMIRYFNWLNYENHDDYMNIDLNMRLERILSYTMYHYREKITAAQLAESENINRNYLSQFLSKTVFSSFSSMVNFIRCYKAETLLLTTEMSNIEISFECGFSDPKYFYAAFKDLWGRTPSEHRSLYRRQYDSALAEIEAMKATKSNAITDDDARLIIKNKIIEWHLDKTFKPVSLEYQE